MMPKVRLVLSNSTICLASKSFACSYDAVSALLLGILKMIRSIKPEARFYTSITIGGIVSGKLSVIRDNNFFEQAVWSCRIISSLTIFCKIVEQLYARLEIKSYCQSRNFLCATYAWCENILCHVPAIAVIAIIVATEIQMRRRRLSLLAIQWGSSGASRSFPLCRRAKRGKKQNNGGKMKKLIGRWENSGALSREYRPLMLSWRLETKVWTVITRWAL